jgi:hypothetical protein
MAPRALQYTVLDFEGILAEITQGERSTTAAITLRPRGTGESRVVEVNG